MNKRKIIIILILLLMVVAAFLVYLNVKEKNKIASNNNRIGDAIISAVDGNTIQVDAGGKKFTVRVDSSTVINIYKVVITEEQIRAGGHFKPQQQTVKGSFTDLKVGLKLNSLVVKEDIDKTAKVSAKEINIVDYDFTRAAAQ